MENKNENNIGNEGQADYKRGLLSALGPLIFVIIVVVLMIIFAD